MIICGTCDWKAAENSELIINYIPTIKSNPFYEKLKIINELAKKTEPSYSIVNYQLSPERQL